MGDTPIIDLQFEAVSKRYRVRHEAARGGLADRLRGRAGNVEDFWALRDVSFGVRRGEALGIIGHNGAGKSTVLKLLSNITSPTTGEITIRGRLSALIEVGSGFHPELTGQENVYLSGSILGMRRSEIRKKLDSIIDFAEVRQFIDTPVKRYSSGMYVRLGFSIAAHLDPDILLLDEVLAVGDAAFQAKCLQRIRDLKENGTTIVFISHDLVAVESLCDRVLLLERGKLLAEGAPADVIATYQGKSGFVRSGAPRGHEVSREAEITGVEFYGREGAATTTFATGEPVRIRVSYVAHEDVRDADVGVYFYGFDGTVQASIHTTEDDERIVLRKGSGAVEFDCPSLVLHPGIYSLDVSILRFGQTMDVDWQYRCATIQVAGGRVNRGKVYLPHSWRLVEAERAQETAPAGARDRA